MDFFELRDSFLRLFAEANGKYELNVDGVTYPTYSVSALNKMLLEVINNRYPETTDLLDAYKKSGFSAYTADDGVLKYYQNLVGKQVAVESVTGYQKMLIDLVRLFNNISYTFEFTTTTENCVVEVGSDFFEDIQFRIDFGDGTVEYTEADNLKHTFVNAGTYIISVKVNKIDNYQNDLFAETTSVPFFINILDTEHSSCKCLSCLVKYPYNETSTDKNVRYIASVPSGVFNSNLECIDNAEPEVVHFGDASLPYLNPVTVTVGDLYYLGNPGIITEIYVQVIGTDFSSYTGEYTALKTLKVAPDDLNTFKTAVTAFNNGNTTATLTVLKGKHQDEAYQWATENGHFASIVKE